MLCTWKLKVRPLDATTVGALLRIVVAGSLMGAGVWGIGRVWPAATTWSGHMLRLFGCVAAGGVVYTGLGFALKLPELKWLLHRGKSEGAASAMSFD